MAKKAATAEGGGAKGEFVVLRIGDAPSPGATVTYVGTASTMKGARELVEKLSDTNAGRLAILEKRQVLVRRPAMAIEEVDETIGGGGASR
jgi:hypothetical protein